MTLRATLTITEDGRVAVPIVPHNNNKDGRITYVVDPESTFGSGTVTVQYSFTGNVATDAEWAGNPTQAAPTTFTAPQIGNLSFNSDQKNPVYIGFDMASSTNPNVIIRIYDSVC